MLPPLPGLDALLEDEDCQAVELRRGGVVVRVLTREGDDAWSPGEEQADALHSGAVGELIRQEFGPSWDALALLLPHEVVLYELEGGAVRVRRTPRGPADARAEEPDLTPVAEALGIPRSRRRAKFEQARRFARVVIGALGQQRRPELRVLDLACGRSYVGVVLVHLLRSAGRAALLHGVDSDPSLVATCRRIADSLGWAGATFEAADLSGYAIETGSYDVAVALHACDTLTDEAVRIACEGGIPLLLAAPCCQRELRRNWGGHPLEWVSRYGLLEQRLADALTDAFRCLVLEALGYEVRVVRFAAAGLTPKNVLIRARLTSTHRPERAREARAFMAQFGVRPRLAPLLERVEG